MHTGPQYYGFSDVLVQRAIAGMYTPEELERAQYGLSQVITVDGTQQLLSASERYAAELMTNVRGIGATTATVLATTTSLGGRHTCMADLTLWLAADNKHMEQLQNYLLNRSVLSSTANYHSYGLCNVQHTACCCPESKSRESRSCLWHLPACSPAWQQIWCWFVRQ